MIEVDQFDWVRKDRWPYSGADHIFVAEALSLIGTGLFGNEWSGRELMDLYRKAHLLEKLPTQLPDSTAARHAGIRILYEQRRSAPSAGELTAEQWLQVLSAEADFYNELPAVMQRLFSAELTLRDACARGLAVAATKTDNGEFWEIKRERWNREDAWIWLRKGIVAGSDIRQNFGGGIDHHKYYLFFRKDSILAANGAQATPAPESIGYLSPYMKLMLDVVAACGINAENHSKRDDVIMPFIESEWEKRELPYSKNLQGAMASMVRDPKAQKGRARKKTG